MRRSPNRLLGILFGGANLLAGVLGFVPAFVTADGLLFGALGVNPALNILHLILGAALLAAALTGLDSARTVNSAVGTALLVLGLVGLFLVGSPVNVLALNVADNVMHFGSTAALLAVGLGVEKRSEPVNPPNPASPALG